MTRLNRKLRRALEEELRGLPTPPPPVDLLDRLRADIPADLARPSAAASTPAAPLPPPGGRRAWHRRPGLRVAAGLALVALAGTVAWQTMQLGERVVTAAPAAAGRSATERDQQRQDATATLRAADDSPSTQGAGRAPLPAEALDKQQAAHQVVTPSPKSPPMEARESTLGARQAAGDELAEAAASPERVRVPEGASSEESLVGLPPAAEALAPAPAAVAQLSEGESPARQRVNEEPSADQPAKQGGSSRIGSLAEVDRRSKGEERRGARPPVSVDSAPPDTMIFRPTPASPFVRTADDALSTFALDVDTGSFTLARAYLERGTLPPPEAIRIEEFVNAMTYREPPPARGDFALVADGAASPYPEEPDHKLLRFTVRARDVARAERKPANLTFVIDVSGSMDRDNRLGLVKRALGLLLDELDAADRVGLVVYGTTGRVLLHPTHELEAIREAIARLVPEGSTNAEEGLRLGYDLADEAWVKGEINRVILCSDGVANVGATGPESILARIGEEARRGIQLTTVGFGMGNYNDALMEQLADQGDGTYHYVDRLEQAREIFVEKLTGTLQTVAEDAKVQVEFDPGTVERWRLLGYANRAVADRDFRADRIDAGEVGAGESATALYEVRLRREARGSDRVATLRLRWKSVDSREVRELAQDLRVRELGRDLGRASRDLRVAALAGLFAERLAGTPAGREIPWRELTRLAEALAEDDARDSDVRSLADLVARAASLAGEASDRPRRRSERLEED